MFGSSQPRCLPHDRGAQPECACEWRQTPDGARACKHEPVTGPEQAELRLTIAEMHGFDERRADNTESFPPQRG